MNYQEKVYSGPGTSYHRVGSLNGGENITVIFKEGGYYFVEYTVTSTNKKKRGYVPTSSVSGVSNVTEFEPSMISRYVNTTLHGYWGPSDTIYAEAVALARGQQVWFLDRKESGYAFIEFSAGGQLYRCYMDTNKLASNVISTTALSKFCSIAEMEAGYMPTSGGTKYGEWYDRQFDTSVNGAAWCAVFVCWCAHFAGILLEPTQTEQHSPFVFNATLVSTMYARYKNNDRIRGLQSHTSDTTPQAGDIAFFNTKNDNPGHVGIVVGLSGTSIIVVEGNTSNVVYRSIYEKNNNFEYSGWTNYINHFGF